MKKNNMTTMIPQRSPMQPHHESSFECLFVQDREEYRFHVRAWNAGEAEESFRTSLRQSGVWGPGRLSIQDPKGAEVLRSSRPVAPN
jgi:hypothetical protein